ncbi:MAG: ABC transporter ATP-binding protein [Planctomycetota bacterium]|jgi:lipopolysaccharide transport system ATP-binding protein
MGQPAIQVEGLSKRYRIGHRRPMADGLRHVLADALARPFRARRTSEELWALRDVNFEVAEGEVLGIVGPNGAGKSTLLKVLSRITPPTEGEARLAGRVGSLLEVGTGFHPELTGRENIYLNGAILGLRRRQIAERFDEIVAFSELERFLDTPVKRYSSGMYVRLAFAVAAHLQPEILLIDEVLAVGDAAFRKKCLGKMDQVARGGRTVLFVSHNMEAIRTLCDRLIRIEAGRADVFDDVEQGVRTYLSSVAPPAGQLWQAETASPPQTDVLRPLRLALVDHSGRVVGPVVPRHEPVRIELDVELADIPMGLTLGVAVFDMTGAYLFHSYQTDGPASNWPELRVGPNRLCAELPQNLLNEGDYRFVMTAAIYKKRWLLRPEESQVAVSITIAGGREDSPLWEPARRGPLAPVLRWQATPGGKA